MDLRYTARGIVIHNNQILLMERWRDNLHYFSIPGGGVEPGESAEGALHRELQEETGVVVAVERLVFVVQAFDASHELYLCRYESGKPQLAADAPERFSGPRNRFVPGWQPVSNWDNLPLIYWEPLRQPLLHALQHGFPKTPLIVPGSTSR